MPRGGKREGAGRKPSSLTTKTREIAEKCISGELPPMTVGDCDTATPLEIMLLAMRFYAKQGDLGNAAKVARHAAPYIHPKLASIEHTGADGKDLVPDKFEIVFVKPNRPALTTD